MSFIDNKMPVVLTKCFEYKIEPIKDILKKQFKQIIPNDDFISNKNIVIKPNLLMKASPDKCITTNPTVLEAVIETLKEYSPSSITIAESPGGPYNTTALKIIYKSTGIYDVSEKCNVNLNQDTSFETVANPNGEVCKVFDIITPIVQADIIVNVCKLKTHSLTTMSGAVKNLFGTIPGIEKFEMHTRYKDLHMFERMLVDLCDMHCENKPMISVCDGIYGMEGNGPSGGDIRNFGLLLSSLNPFNLDRVASEILGLNNTVGYIEEAKKRKLCAKNIEDIPIYCDDLTSCKVENLRLPETKSLVLLRSLPTMFGGRINKFFEPRPEIIKNKCIGCGECMRSCPAKTIEIIINKKGKKKASINKTNCIKCYCCQELCPINAVKIKKNPIFKIIK